MRISVLWGLAFLALILSPLSCTPDPVEGQNPGECVDGADNDEDGMFDCADPDCIPAPDCAGDDDDASGDDDDSFADDDDTEHGDDDTDHGDDDSAGPDDDDDDSAGPGDDDDNQGPGEWTNPGDCEDGIDNDQDGLIDCADPDCGNDNPECAPGDDDDDDSAGPGDDDDDGTPGSTPEICTGGIDEDQDNYIDCMDSDCNGDPACSGSAFSGTLVTDSDNPHTCSVAASGPTNCIVTLGNATAGHQDRIDPGEIAELAVGLTSSHGDIGSLNMSLLSPGGATVVLFSAGAVSGADFDGTVLVDNMGCGGTCPSITSSGAPYSGDHSPEESLSSLSGFDINGDWTLSVTNSGTTAGTVTWSILAVLQ